MKGLALLDLILANVEELVKETKIRVTFSCRYHEMEECRVLRVWNKVKRETTFLEQKEKNLSCLGACLQESHGIHYKEEESGRAYYFQASSPPS